MKIFNKQFINLWTSYALSYFGKVNLSLIIPILIATMGMTKGQLGGVVSGFLLAYAAGQFIHGHYSERFNPFTYIGVGLILSAVMNTFLGFAGGFFFLLFLGEVFDGFFQSMGWSSCVRATAALHKSDNATCILGTSYQVGNSVAWLVTGFVIHNFGWEWGFWGAAIIMAVRGITLIISRPYISVSSRSPLGQIKGTLTRNTIVSGVALGILNFVRYGVIVWIPVYLYQIHSQSIDKVGLKIFLIPIAGCLGTLVYNWLSDRFARETLTSIYMVILAIIILLCSVSKGITLTALLVMSGFFLYGPHVFLVTTVPGRNIEKQTVASATGFIDGVGYIGAMLTGVIMPTLIDISWGVVFGAWAGCSLMIVLLMYTLRIQQGE